MSLNEKKKLMKNMTLIKPDTFVRGWVWDEDEPGNVENKA